VTAPLSDADRATLAAVLDELLPPGEGGRPPGAGALGLAEAVALAARSRSGLERFLADALPSLAAENFAGLAREARVARLKALELASPDAFRALLAVAYGGYYQHPRVVEALGLPPRPPFPEGYAVPPTDLALLDPVRARPPFYRR
jgi:hypothetical protein